MLEYINDARSLECKTVNININISTVLTLQGCHFAVVVIRLKFWKVHYLIIIQLP
jgi:hypothetical protein